MRTSFLLAGIALAAGCASVPPSIPEQGALLPTEGKVQVTPEVSYSYGELVAVPVVAWSLQGILTKSLDGLPIFKQPLLLYFVYQPFAPNWSVEEARLDERTYYLRLQAKRFRTGGDGEALHVLKQRARQLQREHGYGDFRLLDYSEGIESSTPVSRRVSEGIVQLVGATGAASRP